MLNSYLSRPVNTMSPRVCILDYGSGNVASVRNAFERLQIETLVSNNVKDIVNASHLVLPGVGAFKSSMEKIRSKIPLSEIMLQISKGKPFLGICVGMQVLAETGFEFENYPGLAIFPGSEVIELPKNIPKPHVGWNSINIIQKHLIMKNIDDGADFYFVHSFFVSKLVDTNLVAETDYGLKFPSVIAKENLIGVQFHPEKSQKNGDKLLRNFVKEIN